VPRGHESMSSYSVTDAALLDRLRDPNDAQAWQEFEAIYRQKVYEACLRHRRDQATAAGLAGAVLAHLREQLPRFQYDPTRGRFRGWLRRVVENALRSEDRADALRGPTSPGGTDHLEVLHQVADPYASDLNALSDKVVRVLQDDARLRRMAL